MVAVLTPAEQLTDLFGPPISVYTRAQAIEDGELVDVTETAMEAGFRCPVAVTRAVWEDCCAWTERDIEARPRQCQDEKGRLWDVVWMAALAGRVNRGRSVALFRVKRVPRPGHGRTQVVTLKLHIGPADDSDAAVTILQRDED